MKENLEKITLLKGTCKTEPSSFNVPFNKGIRIASDYSIKRLEISIINANGNGFYNPVTYLGVKLNVESSSSYQLKYDELAQDVDIDVYFSDTCYEFDDSMPIPH